MKEQLAILYPNSFRLQARRPIFLPNSGGGAAAGTYGVRLNVLNLNLKQYEKGSFSMISLSRQEILRMCSNRLTFLRGLHYLQQGAVKEISYDQKEGCIKVLVQGTYLYEVGIYLEESNRIEVSCDCPSFSKYEGICKHVAATLLALSEKPKEYNFHKDMDLRMDTDKGNLLDELLEKYAGHAAGSIERKEASIHLHLRVENPGGYGTPRYYISLTIGEKGARKYVVRNIDKLIDAILQQHTLHFGRQFTYTPSYHYFSPKSSQLIDCLVQIYEVEKHSHWYNSPQIVKGREIELSAALFRRLLTLLKEKPFTLEINSQVYDDIEIAEAELPLLFRLKESAKGLALELADAGKLIPLTRECDVILHGKKIYRLAGSRQSTLMPLLQIMINKARGSLAIPANREQRFFSELYPLLKSSTELAVSPALEKRLYRPPLKARVFLDYEEGAIVARLEYVYGRFAVNPFDNAPPKTVDEEPGESSILIRDLAAEQRVMHFFEEGEFTLRGGKMQLKDPEKILRFIYEIIPALQQQAAVYYSESFKQTCRKAPRFSSRVGINWDLDLLELDLELEGVDPEELNEVWQSIRIKRKYHRLADGSILPLEGEGVRQFARLAKALDLQPADLKGKRVRLPKHQALYLDRLSSDCQIAPVEMSQDLAALIRSLRQPAEADCRVPASLEHVLREYQKTGFKWLKSLARHGFGGILADDMGLGKTVQAIAFILSEREEGGPSLPPALVVAPASLIYNWEAEIKRFAPRLKALVIAGTKSERRELLARAKEADVVITSYPLLRRDITDYVRLQFSSCFLDEAQQIKNPQSLTAQCARRIRAKHRFALTGTPMENSLVELWSIFQFIMPGYLQSQKAFLQKYGGPTASPDNPALENGPALLAAKVRPFIMRRVKEEVLRELPPKIEHRLLSELTREQKKLYLAYLEQLRKETRERLENEGFQKSRIHILAGLTRLRQICCHPALFVENYHGESAKLLQLAELLQEAVGGGHRVLIFSQFTEMLQLIREMLDREGYRYFYLDGSVKTSERLQLVRTFNRGEAEIFLISLRAGGTGLNLTGADVVVKYDLWWNPAVEEQAAGRAHRIGQRKVVQVFRLLAKDTIEEKIYELQQKKRALIDQVIRPGETFLSAMSESDIRHILEL